MIPNLAEKRDEDKKMVIGFLFDVVDRPTGFACKSFDVYCDDITGFSHENDVNGLLVA